MDQPPVPGVSSPPGALPPRNRLTTAHLLLWMAGTGLALVYFQSQRPPPPEKIGFASFITAPGADVEPEMAKARQQIWRGWQNRYLLGLAASPIYGAALAGIGLAIWRTVTGRFGFPARPGHWVLLETGLLWGLVALSHQLHLLPLTGDGRDLVLASVMFTVAAAAALLVGQSGWRVPMVTFACGLAILCLAYLISFGLGSIEPPAIFGVGHFVLGTVPFLALLVAILDLAEGRPYDIFHWIGVATFFGVVGHFLALVGAARL